MLIEWLHRIYCKVKSNTMEVRNFMSMFCSIHFHFSQNRSSRQEVCNLIKKETAKCWRTRFFIDQVRWLLLQQVGPCSKICVKHQSIRKYVPSYIADIISDLMHAASIIWTCAEHKFRLFWMELCCDNYGRMVRLCGKICFCVFLVYPEYLLNVQAAGTKKKDARSKKINGVFA